MYVRRNPRETVEQALDRAINHIGIVTNQCEMKTNQCERLKIDRKEQNEVIRKKDALIKSLSSELKALKIQTNDSNDLPIREKLAATKAKNVKNQETIRQLSEENAKLESSNSAKDKIIKSLETENKRLKCQLEKADPLTHNQNGASVMKPKVEPTVAVVDKEATEAKPLQRKRKAEINIEPIATKVSSLTGATSNDADTKDISSDFRINYDFANEVTSNKQCYFILNQNFIFSKKH